MNTPISTDLSPYLVDIYIHTQHIASTEHSPEQFVAFVKALKKWWQRHNELELVLYPAFAHAMLGMLNLTFGYTWTPQIGTVPGFEDDIFRLKAEIIHQLANQGE